MSHNWQIVDKSHVTVLTSLANCSQWGQCHATLLTWLTMFWQCLDICRDNVMPQCLLDWQTFDNVLIYVVTMSCHSAYLTDKLFILSWYMWWQCYFTVLTWLTNSWQCLDICGDNVMPQCLHDWQTFDNALIYVGTKSCHSAYLTDKLLTMSWYMWWQFHFTVLTWLTNFWHCLDICSDNVMSQY